MRTRIIIGITILAVIIISGVLYTKIPVKVDKDYKVLVYSAEKQPIKEISVKIKGNKYNGLINRDYFTGIIEVEGETTQISSTKDRKAVFSGLDTQKFYSASSPDPNSGKQGTIELKASVIISKDFNTVYGYTPALKQKYGKGSYFKTDKGLKTIFDEGLTSYEEAKLIGLYVEVMKDAFKIENGGNEFIAIKMETLKDITNEKAKEKILNEFKVLSPNVHEYEKVKGDRTKFNIDNNGHLISTIKGTVLSVDLKEYKENEAIIEATSWFGNLGAVFPEYKATYKNGKWILKNIGTSIS